MSDQPGADELGRVHEAIAENVDGIARRLAERRLASGGVFAPEFIAELDRVAGEHRNAAGAVVHPPNPLRETPPRGLLARWRARRT